MSDPQKQQSNAASPGQARSSPELTEEEKKILKKFVKLMSEVDVNFKEDSGTTKHLQPLSQEGDKHLQPRFPEEFSRFCQKHSDIKLEVQALFNALGNGERAITALERFQQVLVDFQRTIYCSLFDERSYIILVDPCAAAIRAFERSIQEILATFKEFGILNTVFFDQLKVVKEVTQDILSKLDIDYTNPSHPESISRSCHFDVFLDGAFLPLVPALEEYFRALSNLTEDLHKKRKNQILLSSQEYLNLATIATFLSSVTATTLQITADNSSSLLARITNLLWFISLVFSSASSVYSLLVMTWRQSSVRRPDLVLPPMIYNWLRNGSMFSLIAALEAFSIGLCLLAFIVSGQQGSSFPAIPTVFAGLHALVILILSIWYIIEQWRAPYTNGTIKVVKGVFSVVKSKVRTTIEGTKSRRMAAMHVIGQTFWNRTGAQTLPTTTDDISGDVLEHPSKSTASNRFTFVRRQESVQLNDLAATAAPGSIAKTFEGQLTAIKASPLRESDLTSLAPDSALYTDLLQFSPGCMFLASSFSNIVTIYDVRNCFKVLHRITTQDADRVEQIEWNPNKVDIEVAGASHLEVDLLVRYRKVLVVWSIRVEWGKAYLRQLGQLNEVTGTVRWLREDLDGIVGFSCQLDGTLKIFDITCKKVIESYDLAKIPHVGVVCDVALFKSNTIAILTKVEQESQLRMIDRVTTEVTWRGAGEFVGQTRLTVSQLNGTILVHGRNKVVNCFVFGDLLEVKQYWSSDGSPMTSGFCGLHDKLLHRCLDNMEIVIDRCQPDGTWEHEWFHRFAAKLPASYPHELASFAIGLYPPTSHPYLFAFGDADGSLKIWSIQGNDVLDRCKGAELLEYCDARWYPGRSDHGDVYDRVGKVLTIPSPVSLQGQRSEVEIRNENANEDVSNEFFNLSAMADHTSEVPAHGN